MKKGRLISAFTSAAMIFGMASSLPFSALAMTSTVRGSQMSMKLEADKSSFTMDEVKAGSAKTTVTMYIDDLSEAEKVGFIKAGVAASNSNIKISNFRFNEPIDITTVDTKATDSDDPDMRELDKVTSSRIPQVSIDTKKNNFIIQTDGDANWFVYDIDNPRNGIVKFEVEFPADMAEGKYTINFSGIEVNTGAELYGHVKGDPDYGTVITDYSADVSSNSVSATIELGSGSTSTTTTTPKTTTTTPKTTTTTPKTTTTTQKTTATTKTTTTTPKTTTKSPSSSSVTTPNDGRNYEGEIKIWGDKVEANPGETVKIGLYAEVMEEPKEVFGFELRALYDKTALTLKDMVRGAGFSLGAQINKNEGVYVLAGNAVAQNNPEKPFATLTFEVPADAKAGAVYNITYEGSNDAPIPVVLKKSGKGADADTFFNPVMEAASITIKGGTTSTGDDGITVKVENPDTESNSLLWYHADNKEFYRDGIIVINNATGEDVTKDAKVLFNQVPSEVYNGKAGKYTIEYKVEYNGKTYEGYKIDVMIGVRGDADLSGGRYVSDLGAYTVQLQDAIAIARSLLPNGKKIDTKTWNGYVTDINEDGKIDLQDTIRVAKALLPDNLKKGTGWAKIDMGKGISYDDLINN